MTGIEIPDLDTQGLELVFIAFPQALSTMSPSILWAALFFLSLFLLGIDSVFSSVEVVVSAMIDQFGVKKVSRELISAVICIVLFSMTLPNCFNGGIYFYKLLDWYTCVQSVAIIGCLEVVTVLWIYGARKLRYFETGWTALNLHLSTDIRLATGIKTPKVIEFVWMVVTPLLVIMILFFSIANYQRITYGTYEVHFVSDQK